MTGRIAIIPARGGSKRIPRKNIADFNGRPMLVWTVQAAIESGCFDRVLVSTDSQEIADIAIAAGASVPFLRDIHGDDHTPVSVATIGALVQAEAHWDEQFGNVVQLMANCPLRTAGDIQQAVDHFHANDGKFQISCFRFGWMNPWWAVSLSRDGEPTKLFPELMTRRSQDLEPLYCPTGAIWVASREDLIRAGTFYGPGHKYFPLAWEAAVDIDDLEDFRMALAVAQFRQEHRPCP